MLAGCTDNFGVLRFENKRVAISAGIKQSLMNHNLPLVNGHKNRLDVANCRPILAIRCLVARSRGLRGGLLHESRHRKFKQWSTC